jgi:hypothetical protein
MEAVQKLRGDDMDAYLRRHPTVLYRYQPNRPGFIFLMVLASFAGAIGVWMWATGGLTSIPQTLLIGALLAVAVSLTVVVGYWTYFTRVHWVAASDRHLLVGKGRHVTAIEWNALDVGNLDFAGSSDGDRFLGVLSLRLGQQRVKLRLFNGFAVLRNLQGFISTLLSHVREPA